MNYHMVLTRRCNLNCHYCHGGEESGPDGELKYSVDDLARFLEKDYAPQLMFYGGEPTLRIELMKEMMDIFSDARFMLQTNGLRLNRIPVQYVHRLHSILISIDGTEEVTDFYRSKGVYKKVLKNVSWLREQGFNGDIVARMAVSQESDIYREVRHLLDLRNPHFDHVHWQLNVIWDAEGNWQDFDRWVSESYNPGIKALVHDWLNAMRNGIVEGIVPFIPIMRSLLTREDSLLRCGSGLDTFAIHVDGSIGVCPISPDWEFSLVGDIWKSSPDDIRDIMKVEDPCPTCEEYGICGGRCLFANKQRLWGEDGFDRVCGTVKYLIAQLRDVEPEVQRLIKSGIVRIEDFHYPEYNNGCEIIP
ncbi:MAG: TIGR04084 family radical SAM/SPASM domain-containing protein [Candidatus Thorarchaeota archaeon]